MAMIEYRVSLQFDCCGCDRAVGVTVECRGKGLICGQDGAAKVNVPCPMCSEINQVLFDSDGTVCCVRPFAGFRTPVPSVN